VSLALARKYRPATFDDLIGQEAVSQTLSLALDSNRLSHAYLFSGLRGSGKTSTARIFAKALLCEKGAVSHPCGECIHCKMASDNSHMDIIEMDAASNRGIDDIRDLIEHTKYKPSSARYKIFIIDEVHMLTNQAFNALLKTLEEPPDFIKFILATTDPLKLPATILSRTQHFRFKKIPRNLVLIHLEHILNLEKIEYEKDALDILARTGAGSLRDSLTLLDQAIVYSKNFVDINTVTKMLGIIEPSLLEQLLDDINQKDKNKILEFVKMASNYEAEMILDELTLYLKELLLAQNSKFTPMIIERFFRVIAESKGLLALGSDGEFVLALSLFKMMEALEIKDIDAMIRGLEKELKGVEISEITVTTPPITEIMTITENDITDSALQNVKHSELNVKKGQESHKISTNKEKSSPPETIEPKKENNNVETKLEKPTQEINNLNSDKFDNLVKKIYDRNYDLGMCFENNITFESFEDSKLTWQSTAEDADKKLLITHWGVINMLTKDIFGFETKIINISKKKLPNPSINESSITQTSNKKSSPMQEDTHDSLDAGGAESTKEQDPSSLLQEPMVKEAIALFDPKKVRIKRNT